MMTPEERYHRDPHFASLVDVMHDYLRRCMFTGTEIREAAILAAIHNEQFAMRSSFEKAARQ
jgi:hypothetical protein